MTAYRRDFDEFMSFLIKDKELMEKYNEMWDKVSNVVKKYLILNQYAMKTI